MGEYETASSVQKKGPTTVIEIQFGLENTINSIDECITPTNEDRTQGLSGKSGSCSKGKFMTHPAFLAFDTNGLWVGKYETGYKNATTTQGAQQNNSNSSNIVIKPDQFSWRNITIENSYTASLNYKKDLLSHNMKNTEWGAMAYLTQSKYGRCEESNCTEVTVNANTNYKTGYNNNAAYPNSQNASTTGNNTGIFDVHGGAWEQMASVMEDSLDSKIPLWSESGLSSIDDKRYYDIYSYTTDQGHWKERRILGDAIGELGPFQVSGSSFISSYFDDYADYPYSTSSWEARGGRQDSGFGAGIFSAGPTNGSTNALIGFRVVLAPR